jgi:3-methyladenine DNA glycosylase/8-oxoguanine DNA glycosylase
MKRKAPIDSIELPTTKQKKANEPSNFRKLLDNVKDEWLPGPREPFHAWVSCIMSQMARFESIRNDVRMHLYQKWGDNNITAQRILALEETDWQYFAQKRMRSTQRKCLTQLAQLFLRDPSSPIWSRAVSIAEFRMMYPEIKGVGEWTVKAVALYAQFPVDPKNAFFLSQDKYIRNHVQVLTGSPHKLTERQAYDCIRDRHEIKVEEYPRLSMILWRLKKNTDLGQALSKECFHTT